MVERTDLDIIMMYIHLIFARRFGRVISSHSRVKDPQHGFQSNQQDRHPDLNRKDGKIIQAVSFTWK